jgi:hypothetical protein
MFVDHRLSVMRFSWLIGQKFPSLNSFLTHSVSAIGKKPEIEQPQNKDKEKQFR